MSDSQFDFASIADDVAALEADANVAKEGGGSYTPPPVGLARLRLVGYMELGKHFKKGNPAKRIPDKDVDVAWLIFELSGKGYEPKELDDGTKIPMRITVKLNHSLNPKAGYYRLFKKMNYEGTAKSFIQLLGKAYIGNVAHFKPPVAEGAEPIVIANFIDGDGNLTIRPPRIESMNEETGEIEIKTLPVAPAISAQRCLVWKADAKFLPMMWASIAIPEDDTPAEDGKEKKSRNVYQNMVKEAKNFEGSPIHQYLQSAGADLGIPPADTGKASDAAKPDADDPLNGVG